MTRATERTEEGMTEAEAIEQITIICRDNRHSTADLTSALKEIRKIAANARDEAKRRDR